MTRIILAREEHIPILVPLVDNYRIFYKQASDRQQVKSFLEKRIKNKESTIFIALIGEEAVGFTQLYTTFSSVSLQPVFILNDLFVNGNFRHKGIGEKLLQKAKDHCREKGFKGLSLETAIDNPAQKLYERLGWKKDSQCFHYFWTLS